MSGMDIFYNRRSVRKYENREIAAETVDELLKAAMSAPSAVAKDPWRFIVLRDRKKLKEVASGLPNGVMLGDAAVGVIVCGDIDAAHDNSLSYMIQDCSAAIENLLLAASMHGLGACWLGVHPREERVEHIRQIFSLPKNIIPISAIAIGHPAESPEPRCRYNKDYVHHGEW